MTDEMFLLRIVADSLIYSTDFGSFLGTVTLPSPLKRIAYLMN